MNYDIIVSLSVFRVFSIVTTGLSQVMSRRLRQS